MTNLTFESTINNVVTKQGEIMNKILIALITLSFSFFAVGEGFAKKKDCPRLHAYANSCAYAAGNTSTGGNATNANNCSRYYAYKSDKPRQCKWNGSLCVMKKKKCKL